MESNKKIKVLVINTVPTEKNGITNVIINIINNFDYENVQIDLLTINEPDDYYKNVVKKNGGKIFTIRRDIKRSFEYVKRLSKIIRKEKYTIVHAHGNSHTLALEMIAAKMAGCNNRIAHSHSTSCKFRLLHNILTPIFLRLYTLGIACGENAGKWLFEKKPFKIINNGINTKDFSFNINNRVKVRKQLGIDDDCILIGHIGDFHTENKNQKFLIKLIKYLNKNNEKYHCVFIGDGEKKGEIELFSRNEGVSRQIHFLGCVSNTNEYYSAFDMFILPSFFEGFPLTLIEAQASGTMVYASDRITKEVKLTETLSFFNVDAVEELAEKIKKNEFVNDREKESRIACDEIQKKGFDIVTECRKLKAIYLSMM